MLAWLGLATGRFIVSGIQQTASVAAMFVFAILYFGVTTDAGMLDPIVDRILRAVGTRLGGTPHPDHGALQADDPSAGRRARLRVRRCVQARPA
jgi:hypothetical protein